MKKIYFVIIILFGFLFIQNNVVYASNNDKEFESTMNKVNSYPITNIEDCGKLIDTNNTERKAFDSSVNGCLYFKALLEKDETQCFTDNMYGDSTLWNNCYAYVAILKKDPEICKKMETGHGGLTIERAWCRARSGDIVAALVYNTYDTIDLLQLNIDDSAQKFGITISVVCAVILIILTITGIVMLIKGKKKPDAKKIGRFFLSLSLPILISGLLALQLLFFITRSGEKIALGLTGLSIMYVGGFMILIYLVRQVITGIIYLIKNYDLYNYQKMQGVYMIVFPFINLFPIIYLLSFTLLYSTTIMVYWYF